MEIYRGKWFNELYEYSLLSLESPIEVINFIVNFYLKFHNIDLKIDSLPTVFDYNTEDNTIIAIYDSASNSYWWTIYDEFKKCLFTR